MCVACSKLHPEGGESLLPDLPPGVGHLPDGLRLCGKLDMLDQVRLQVPVVPVNAHTQGAPETPTGQTAITNAHWCALVQATV